MFTCTSYFKLLVGTTQWLSLSNCFFKMFCVLLYCLYIPKVKEIKFFEWKWNWNWIVCCICSLLTQLVFLVSFFAVLCLPSVQYACSDGFQCLPSIWHCDHMVECKDFSDEENCGTLLQSFPYIILFSPKKFHISALFAFSILLWSHQSKVKHIKYTLVFKYSWAAMNEKLKSTNTGCSRSWKCHLMEELNEVGQ